MKPRIAISEEMLNGIILSIYPKYNEMIFEKEKKFEFRNFVPKNYTSYFWVYESKPTKALKYIMKVSRPIIFPDKINCLSYGVERFNNGIMDRKYAYEIESIYVLDKPLDLNFLSGNFNFTAPQAFTYLRNNNNLLEYLRTNVKIFEYM